MNHGEIFQATWEDKEDEWLLYVKNEMSSTVFCSSRYSKGIEKITRFGMKNSLTLPSLAKKTSEVWKMKTTNLFTLILMKIGFTL